MHPFLIAALGGVLIGLASALLLLFNGRIAGISGIAGGLFSPARGDAAWRAAFVGGLIVGGLLLHAMLPSALGPPVVAGLGAPILAGLLVGFGTRLGNGCTSGHGVCGMARGSMRSIAATLTFMVTAALTVYVVRHVIGGI